MTESYEWISREVIAGLRQIGYLGALLEEDYAFSDWFTPQREERTMVAAAFGQTPPSYESACIGVARSNGCQRESLVNSVRALGAPIILEIDQSEVREWGVSRDQNNHKLVASYPASQIAQALARRAQDWTPQAVLRSKNIGTFNWNRQYSLFSGLLPDLEYEIQQQLDPMLRAALSATSAAYRESTGRNPNYEHLFRLIFWLLAAKVFHDRRVNGFASLGPDPEAALRAVARHYRTDTPRLLNREARLEAANNIWYNLDFRNLSVEVLAQIWSVTLVDPETRKKLGIHRTSRTIVSYIVERTPFSSFGDDKLIIFEPCSGSATFLIGAMNALRANLFAASPQERHRYYINHLAGLEKEPFGAELSRLALTLADFPNSDGWDIAQRDVFEPATMTDYLRRSAVVLCNPPFEDFGPDERAHFKSASPKKPVELLNRILDDLHPSGVLGFVLPDLFVDGHGYSQIRKRLSERFGSIELTLLPDKAFEADAEVALLVAKEPIPHDVCRVSFRRVNDDDASWKLFQLDHSVSSDTAAVFHSQEVEAGLRIPELPEVWSALRNHPTLNGFAEVRRGIEWNKPLTIDGKETGNREILIGKSPAEGFMKGVAPRTSFNMFEVPSMCYLSLLPEDRRLAAWKLPWRKPKAIMNKSTRSRGKWRIAAFPDSEGVVCYQTYFGVWPRFKGYDEVVLAAILNSPVANAFVATREGKTDITAETMLLIPMPVLTDSQKAELRSLVVRYQSSLDSFGPLGAATEDPETLLKHVDAAILDGYHMPPRVERQLLDYFRGQRRPVAHRFGDYVPPGWDVYFSLSQMLSPDVLSSNAGAMLRRAEEL